MPDRAEEVYERLLVVRAQTGDAAAFTELVDRYHARLRYFVRKLLAERDWADDVLQDVWLDAWRGLPRLRNPGALASWLYRVARDRAYRRLRVRQHDPPSMGEVELAETVPDETALAEEDAEAVHRALDRLSLEHREALVLRFMEGMGYEDIAAVVGCSVGTVRSRLHYAKAALRRLLEQDS